MSDRHITLDLIEATKEHLAREGYDPVCGARPLKRFLQRDLETPLSRQLIADEITDHSCVTVEFKKGEGEEVGQHVSAVSISRVHFSSPLRPSPQSALHATLLPVKTINQNLLDEVANRLANELHPEGIWLFGSHAWGTPDEGSDLDLFVVVPESNEAPVERMRRAHRCLRGLGIAKDVLVKTRQEFDRLRALPSTLDYLVFHRGRKLYG